MEKMAAGRSWTLKVRSGETKPNFLFTLIARSSINYL